MRKFVLITIAWLIALSISSALAADDKVHGGVIVRSSALVVADTNDRNTGWPNWWIGIKAKQELERLGYKIYDDRLLDCQSGDVIHLGLENSSVFFFAGHGSPTFIGDSSAGSWGLQIFDMTNDENEHSQHPDLVLVRDDQYLFVFLDACETGWKPGWLNDSWSDKFDIYDDDRGKVFLGWRVKLYDEPGAYSNRVFNPWTYFGNDHPRWTRFFWKYIGQRKTVDQSRQKASESWKTKNVEDTFGLCTTGDTGLKLK